MTGREMQKEFEQSSAYIDEIKKGDINLISDDVNFFLNEAQHTYINIRLNNIKKSIKSNQKSIDEIRAIVIKGSALVLDAGLSTPERNVYDLPVDYNYLISDYTNTTYCGTARNYQNRLVNSENLQEILIGTHTKPKYNSPISELIGNKLYVYIDYDLTFTINSVIIDYVKTWVNIDVTEDVTSELDPNVHKDIVQLAVNLFLESIQSGRFRTNTEKNILNEKLN